VKKSVFWRLVIIIVILSGWFYSLFPLTDRPFYDVLKEEANARIDAGFEKVIEHARKIDNSNSGSLVTPAKAVLASANELNINLRDYIPIYNQPNANNQTVVNYVRRRTAGKIRLGLDLRGGTEFVIEFDKDKLAETDPDKNTEEARDEIIEILRNRVDQSGVVEAEIKPIGPASISLKIPSIDADDIQKFREIVQATAKLDFRLVHEDNLSLVNQEQNKNFKPPIAYERMLIQPAPGDKDPPQVLYVKRIPERVSGRHIRRAFPNVNQFGTYSVSLEFNNEGANLFHKVTKDSVGRRLAIVLDGTVYSAPNINEPIAGGRAEISGNFSPDEANKLGVVLRCGNLPVPISVEGEFSTDPTLGKDSIQSGKFAALTGLALVMVFMFIYYLTAGIVADVALAANILLVLGTLTIAGATITLPGIAGIVLTIGMAVDANVLIFERIREELQHKKSIANAIHTGYNRAFVTIIDANLTTLITALILYKFGSGAIRGFAVTLSIGIVASLFTALFMTRAIFDLLIVFDLVKKIKMLNLFNFRNLDFLDLTNLLTKLSMLVMALALVVIGGRGKSALSVDFTGGTAITFNYKAEIDPGDIRKVLERKGYQDARISYKASAQQETKLMEIVFGSSLPKEIDIKVEIKNLLNEKFPEAGLSGGSTKSIGGLVGARFTKQAISAVVFALVGIIIYITFRFEFGYAFGAVAALAHDVIICSGIFLIVPSSLVSLKLAERQLSLPVIAALLTIIGYSLNDTIVVFDRIRENLGLIKNMKYREIINLSINDTMSRTVLTSVTTLIVVVMLCIFGGGAINDFAFVMLVGVIIGTYSSIFIATPTMIYWHNRKAQQKELAAAGRSLAEKPA
jgi:SecD/SecF fusion protein